METPASTAWREFALEATARYFTRRSDDPNGEDLLFDEDVDPKGYLNAIRSSTLFHGKDNQVLYFQVIEDEGKPV